MSLSRFAISNKHFFAALVANTQSLKLFLYEETLVDAKSKLVIIPAITGRQLPSATGIGSHVPIKIGQYNTALNQYSLFLTFTLFYEEWIPFEKQHQLDHNTVIAFPAGSTTGSSIVVLMEVLVKIDSLTVKNILQAGANNYVPKDIIVHPNPSTATNASNVAIVGTNKQNPWVCAVSSTQNRVLFTTLVSTKLPIGAAYTAVWQSTDSILIGGSEADQTLPQQEFVAFVNLVTGTVTTVMSLANSSQTQDAIIAMRLAPTAAEPLIIGRNFVETSSKELNAAITLATPVCTSPWWLTAVILGMVVLVGLGFVSFLLICLCRMLCLRVTKDKYESL